MLDNQWRRGFWYIFFISCLLFIRMSEYIINHLAAKYQTSPQFESVSLLRKHLQETLSNKCPIIAILQHIKGVKISKPHSTSFLGQLKKANKDPERKVLSVFIKWWLSFERYNMCKKVPRPRITYSPTVSVYCFWPVLSLSLLSHFLTRGKPECLHTSVQTNLSPLVHATLGAAFFFRFAARFA